MNVDEQTLMAIAGALLVVILVFILVISAIYIFISYLLYKCFERIPPQFRKQQPGMVWLLLIPCFSLIWNFFVFPPLSKSFKAYFDSIGETNVDDCGEKIGLAYSICSVANLIPYLNILTGIATLVLLILFLVKTNDLKNRIKETPSVHVI